MDSTMTIYEDVAALMARVAELESKMTTVKGSMAELQPTPLTAGTDINNLGVGTYYIPTVDVSATILNKPVESTSNAAIIVLNGATNGELQQWYFINTKNTAYNNKVYHRYFYDNEWSIWETGYLKPDDSGWLELPLAAGVGKHNASAFPCQYRKIGNVVHIRGCINGFDEVEKVVATLPVGYRPSNSFYTVQSTNGGNIDTFNVRTNGTIERISTTLPNLATSNYHFLNIEYFVD